LAGDQGDDAMRNWTMPALLMGAIVAGCAPQTPEQAQIANIEDAASNVADAIESASQNQVAQIRGQADTIAAQAEIAKGYDAEKLKTRAEALRKEAEIVARQADAKVQAVRDRARADVSALKAQ
jgi:hypothetical protein